MLKILIVEDDAQLATTLKYLVEDNPRYRVVATADDLDVIQAQPGHDLVEKRRPAQQGLDQGHGDVRARDGHHEARQSRSCPDVAHRGTVRDHLAQDGRVEHVPVPELVDLAWSDQSPHHSLSSQEFGVADGKVQPVRRERPPCRLGHGGRFT